MWLFGLLLWRFRPVRSLNFSPSDPAAAVVVARNEVATIGSCLLSLLGQQPRLTRVILADDGSTDGSARIVAEVASVDERLEVIKMPQIPRPASPKKEALALAFSRIAEAKVCCTDADCVVPIGWAEALQGTMKENYGVVLGASFPPRPQTFFERAYRWERLIANCSMASACGWGYPASACGHSILYRAEALREVNGPVRRDLPSGDDDLTVQAIAKAGWHVQFCAAPESVVSDLGGGKIKRWSQAGRHQSVTHLYPLRWRALFAATVVANIFALSSLFVVPWLGWSFSLMLILPRAFLDFVSAMLLRSQLRLDIPAFEVMIASLCQPVWSLWRALAVAFSSRIEWRGREFSPASS